MEESCSLLYTADDPHWYLEDSSDSDVSDRMLSTIATDVASAIWFLSYQDSMIKMFFFLLSKELKPVKITFEVMVLTTLSMKNSEWMDSEK